MPAPQPKLRHPRWAVPRVLCPLLILPLCHLTNTPPPLQPGLCLTPNRWRAPGSGSCPPVLRGSSAGGSRAEPPSCARFSGNRSGAFLSSRFCERPGFLSPAPSLLSSVTGGQPCGLKQDPGGGSPRPSLDIFAVSGISSLFLRPSLRSELRHMLQGKIFFVLCVLF